MKNCPTCGLPTEDGTKFCAQCGYAFPAESILAAEAAPRVSTKKEYLRLPEAAQVKKELVSSAVICYVCAGLSLILGLAVQQNYLIVLDVLILVGLGLGIHLAQSRVCAIILCVYAGVNMIYGLITTGRPAGYLIVIAGVFAAIYTFKLEKQWQQYRQGG